MKRKITMKCSKEQFESIKPKLSGFNLDISNEFYTYKYLTNASMFVDILNVKEEDKNLFGSELYEKWDESLFLKCLGIGDEVYPKVLFTNHVNDVKSAKKRVVIAYKKGLYITWNNAETLEDAKDDIHTSFWKYAWDVNTKQKLEFPIIITTEEAKKIIYLSERMDISRILAEKFGYSIALDENILIDEELYIFIREECMAGNICLNEIFGNN